MLFPTVICLSPISSVHPFFVIKYFLLVTHSALTCTSNAPVPDLLSGAISIRMDLTNLRSASSFGNTLKTLALHFFPYSSCIQVISNPLESLFPPIRFFQILSNFSRYFREVFLNLFSTVGNNPPHSGVIYPILTGPKIVSARPPTPPFRSPVNYFMSHI